MPVGNQLKYWDGAAWVPHVAPTGAQGPQGPVGPGISAGMCAFTGGIASLPSATHMSITNLAVVPALTDKEPCLTVKSPTKLAVARPGTIMFSVMLMVGGGMYVPANATSYIELMKGASAAASLSWAIHWSDGNGFSGILTNLALAIELGVDVRLMLNAPAPITCTIYAAVTP